MSGRGPWPTLPTFWRPPHISPLLITAALCQEGRRPPQPRILCVFFSHLSLAERVHSKYAPGPRSPREGEVRLEDAIAARRTQVSVVSCKEQALDHVGEGESGSGAGLRAGYDAVELGRSAVSLERIETQG